MAADHSGLVVDGGNGKRAICKRTARKKNIPFSQGILMAEFSAYILSWLFGTGSGPDVILHRLGHGCFLFRWVRPRWQLGLGKAWLGLVVDTEGVHSEEGGARVSLAVCFLRHER